MGWVAMRRLAAPSVLLMAACAAGTDLSSDLAPTVCDAAPAVVPSAPPLTAVRAVGAGPLLATTDGVFAEGDGGLRLLSASSATAVVTAGGGAFVGGEDGLVARYVNGRLRTCQQFDAAVLALAGGDSGVAVATWTAKPGPEGVAQLFLVDVECRRWTVVATLPAVQIVSLAMVGTTICGVSIDLAHHMRAFTVQPGKPVRFVDGVRSPRGMLQFAGRVWVPRDHDVLVLDGELRKVESLPLPGTFLAAASDDDQLVVAFLGTGPLGTGSSVFRWSSATAPPTRVDLAQVVRDVGANLGGWFLAEGTVRSLADGGVLAAQGAPVRAAWLSDGTTWVQGPYGGPPLRWQSGTWTDGVARDVGLALGASIAFPVGGAEVVAVARQPRSIDLSLLHDEDAPTALGSIAVAPSFEKPPFRAIAGQQSLCSTDVASVVTDGEVTFVIKRDTGRWTALPVDVADPLMVASHGGAVGVGARGGIALRSADGVTWHREEGLPYFDAEGRPALLHPALPPDRAIAVRGGVLLEVGGQITFETATGSRLVGTGRLLSAMDSRVLVLGDEGLVQLSLGSGK